VLRGTFDTDRAIAAFLIVGTAFLLLELAFPEWWTPFEIYFDWGGAQIVGTGAWMAICMQILVAAIVSWRR
jgi:hypothetical protein